VQFFESSLSELYQSAVDAFPNTTKRQHATQPIEINELKWTPFVGMKTLLLRGSAVNEDREYTPIVLFKGVQYRDKKGKGVLEVAASSGGKVFVDKLSLENDVSVRCNCGDFRYRFAYYNHLDRSLYGPKPTKYNASGVRGPINPMQKEGMCKHVMKIIKGLVEEGIIVEV